jgi:hypothetical protein
MPNSGVITATATDSDNNTSEYSYCRAISGPAIPGKPPKPVQLSPANGESVTLNPPLFAWNGSTGADRYMLIIRQGAPDGPKIYVNKTIQGIKFTPPALPGSGLYYWMVKACNEAGCSKSPKWSVTIL